MRHSFVAYYPGSRPVRGNDRNVVVILKKINESLTRGASQVEQYVDGRLLAVHQAVK